MKKKTWAVAAILCLAAIAWIEFDHYSKKTTAVTKNSEDIAPEITERIADLKAVMAKTGMVVTANPYASRAATEVLCNGGNALDAALAAQWMLNLVEPQSSGIGGGAFLLYYDKALDTVFAYDGRETAPNALVEKDFLDKSGHLREFADIHTGGISVGVPGVVSMLEMAHQQHGKLPWNTLFKEAISLAEQGFPVSPRLYLLLSTDTRLKNDSEAKKIYFDEATGNPKQVDQLIKNQDLAETFKLLSTQGSTVFYRGEIAVDIVKAVNRSWMNPGKMTLEDLAGYQAKVRDPVSIDYRQYKIVGFPPPSSGGVAVLQIMGILENLDLTKYAFDSAEAVHLIAEASNLAFADRNRYVADPDEMDVPVDQLLDKQYLKERARLISLEKSMGKALPGKLLSVDKAPQSLAFVETPSTTQISIVDPEGNAVSMTSSVEHAYGAGIVVRGFFLNNQMTDFTFLAQNANSGKANTLEPGKRPRSSMAPTLVFDQNTGELSYVIGSSGGARIISYVAKSLIGMLEYRMDPQEAISFPNFSARNGPLELEKDTFIIDLKEKLEALGHSIVIEDLNSGLQGIEVTKDGYVGGGDPRRESLVVGADWCAD